MAERKYEYICKECGTTEWLQRWRHKQKTYPDLCTICAKQKGYAKYKNIKITNPKKWNEITKIKQETTKRRQESKTKEERTAEAKSRNACRTENGRREGRRKQHEAIKSDPVKYKKYCEKRRRISQDFHNNMTSKDKELHYRKVLKNRGRSKECDEFIEILFENEILCNVEQPIHGFIVDGIIQNTNIIIEYYGDMFHCNPRKFHNPTQVCSWLGGRTVQEQWDRDKKRLAALYGYGYKVIVVWGSDWKDNPDEVIRRIQNEMYEN